MVIYASNLVADETFDLVGERWQDYLRIGWRPGGLAVGADIYVSINSGVEKLIQTVDSASSFLLKTTVGQTVLARVVGVDVKGNRANYNTAPTITRTMTGVTTNLLINSTFNGSLAHWDVNWRTGDNVQRQTLENEGFVQYNILGSTLAAAQKILSQLSIDPTKWAVGNYVMLSGMVQSGGGMTGNLALEIVFNGAGTTVRAEFNLANATNGPARINTPAATQVPVGTTSIDIIIRVRDGGSGVSCAVGKLITVDHLLFEIVVDNTVSTPSKWADNVDNGTNAANTLAQGNSGALAAQGSVLPVVGGSFSISKSDTQATITWTGMKLRWPFNSFITNIQDGSYIVTGLTASTLYSFFPDYDIMTSGAVKFIEGIDSAAGSPAGAHTAQTDPLFHAYIQNGLVPLGVFTVTTNAPGGGTSGGGVSGGRHGSIQ